MAQVGLLLAVVAPLLAQDENHVGGRLWRPDSFGMAVASTLVFTLLGILVSLIGFKLWDRFTPGNLEEEICKKQNIAAAILGAAIILGTSLIVAAAMIG
jgi:putative membrane protein